MGVLPGVSRFRIYVDIPGVGVNCQVQEVNMTIFESVNSELKVLVELIKLLQYVIYLVLLYHYESVVHLAYVEFYDVFTLKFLLTYIHTK